jgi:hypothetical protein
MTATLTDNLRRTLLLKLADDIADSATHYFVGIGKSELWNDSDVPDTPVSSDQDIRNAAYGLQSIKAVLDWSMVSLRTNWSSGAIYSAWNDNLYQTPINNYYVVTDANQVYMCIQQGKTTAGNPVPSTTQPTGTTTAPFKTSEGYIWKFLFSIGALEASKYLAANFIPTRLVDSANDASPAADVEQLEIQNAAIPKQILGFEITNPGLGYIDNTPPVITVYGDGVKSRAVATCLGGAVTKIELFESNGTPVFGSGYSHASVAISTPPDLVNGITATARPIFGPKIGVGADARVDLRSKALMINVKPDGDEGGDFVIDNEFRQVILIKNPTLRDSDLLFTGLTSSTLRSMVLNAISSPFTVGRIIQGSTSFAKAFIDDKSVDTLWYHQTEQTGFQKFIEGEPITETNGNGAGVLALQAYDADSNAWDIAPVNALSGEIMYIDNRAPITRSAEQIEDIKVVIQL